MTRLAEATSIVLAVVDPEMPYLTLGDLGIIRNIDVDQDGTVTVAITPTYSACPAMSEMKYAIDHRLRVAGFAGVQVRTLLDPPWTTDWITAEGRAKLQEAGIAPPGSVSVILGRPTVVACPRCESTQTQLVSRFSGTACKSLHRCLGCLEPFEHVKAV